MATYLDRIVAAHRRALGLVVGSTAFLALAVAALVVACLGFVVLPLVALSRASRDD